MKIEITSPERIIYKTYNISKLDVINYYNNISRFMFLYLDKRLLTVVRCHSSTNDKCFFKKHPSTTGNYIGKKIVNNEEYFYLKSPAGIVEEAQLGTIEFHTWGSSVNKINIPNMMVFDLDPDEKMSLKQLHQGVLHLKSILDKLNLKSFLKTSGGKGYHILVPFKTSKTWGNFSEFSQSIAKVMEKTWPNLYTTNIRKKERKGKIFIDYLRNTRGATCIAPFSLRAKNKPSVSMPISYENLKKYSPDYFTIFNSLPYIKKNNPWKNIFETEQSLN